MLVTVPVEEPTVAVEVLLLVHTPPVVVFPSVAVAGWHKEVVPVITFTVGAMLTVTVFVAIHDPGIV